MAKELILKISIRGFEDPLTAHVTLEGFEDPLTALDKLGILERPSKMDVSLLGLNRQLRVTTEPLS
jgi:hypothetical protein